MALNKNITKKELGLIKGALRRVFSRSDLRRAAILQARIGDYHDPLRPRVTKWSKCYVCKRISPEYLMDCDHKEPIIPLTETLETLVEKFGWDSMVNNIWCDISNLGAICKDCHTQKTKQENKVRRANKNGKSNQDVKGTASSNRKRASTRSSDKRNVRHCRKIRSK